MRVCPECLTADSLWRSVTVEGWQELDADLKPVKNGDVEWSTAEHLNFGCSECDWEGSDLTTLGIDGRPLPEIHPHQQILEVP